jgi:hypothetical protein
MDELIGRFKDLTLPSRSSTLPETFKRLNDEEIEGLLHKVLQKVSSSPSVNNITSA